MALCGVTAMLGGLVAAGVPALAGSAQRIDDAGWWWRVKQGPLVGVAPAPPTTTAGQLMVEGAPDGAAAIAAVRATLNEGDGNPVLTLKVATNGDSGGAQAILLACQAGAAWSGGEGPQQWEAAPLADCTQSVQGQRSADGTSWAFPIGALQFNDQINVILVPGQDPVRPAGANGSTFELVFEKPTSASIATTDAVAPDDSAGGSFGGGPLGGTDAGYGSYADPGYDTPSLGSSSFSTPPVQPALPIENQGRSATTPRLQARTPALVQPIRSERSGSARALGFLVLLLGAAGSWWYSQQEIPAPRKLGRFAGTGAMPTDVATAPLVGGLGRFARVRSGAPRRLS